MPTQTGSYDFVAASKVHEKLEEAINPIESRMYSGIIGTANTVDDASFYFAKIHPTNYTTRWSVHFKIYVTAPETYTQTVNIEFGGYGSTFSSYDSYVVRNADLGLYFVNLYRATSAGISTNHKGHAVGFGLRASTNPTTASAARTIQADLLEVENCTVDFLDTAVKYANMDGTGSTNYYGLTEMGVATAGQNATNNSNTSYTQFSNAVVAGTFGVKRYTLLMKQSENTWSSFVNEANSVATTKTVSTQGYIPGKLIYSAGGAEYASGANTSTVFDAYPFDFRYSSNCGTTLLSNKPVYLVGTIEDDGLFYLDANTWWTQTIPTEADYRTYIYVGNAYSSYQVWLSTENDVYQFYDGKFMLLSEIDLIKSNNNLNNKIDQEISNVNDTIEGAVTELDQKIDQGISDLNNNINQAITGLDSQLNQDEILRRLTNNFQTAGLYQDPTTGEIYIKANYIKSETLSLGGANNEYGTLMMMDENNEPIGAWDKSGIRSNWFNFQSDSESAYIGRGDSEGVRNVYIDSDSVDIRQGQEVLASFGETTIIGKTGATDAHVDTTGNKMSFKVGIDEVAYIGIDPTTSKSMFYVDNATILNDLQFGNWQWKNRDNGNLSLKWVGGEV